MKKLSLLFLLLATILFTSCVSSKVEGKETMQVSFTNNCNWSIGVVIRIKSVYSNNFQQFTLGKTSKTVELYKDTDYVFLIKGAYDSKPHQIKAHITDEKDIYFDWSSYKNSYVLQRKVVN